jgi:hypothetical protein
VLVLMCFGCVRARAVDGSFGSRTGERRRTTRFEGGERERTSRAKSPGFVGHKQHVVVRGRVVIALCVSRGGLALRRSSERKKRQEAG